MIKNKSFKPVIIGALLLLIPVFLLSLWFYACSQTDGYPDNQELYYSYLPQFLKGGLVISIFSLLLCAIAILINLKNLDFVNKTVSFLSLIVIFFGVMLAFANLWSLM